MIGRSRKWDHMTWKVCITILMIKYCDKLSEMAGYTFFKISENGRFATFHSSNYIATFSFCSNKCSIVIFQFVCICLFRLLLENQNFALHILVVESDKWHNIEVFVFCQKKTFSKIVWKEFFIWTSHKIVVYLMNARC